MKLDKLIFSLKHFHRVGWCKIIDSKPFKHLYEIVHVGKGQVSQMKCDMNLAIKKYNSNSRLSFLTGI